MSRRTRWFALARAAGRCFAISALLWASSMPLLAQDTTRALNATTLKRIAEAVEGYTRGGRVFVVLDSAKNVTGIFPRRFDAESLARSLRQGEVYGPFDAPTLARTPAVVLARCVHIKSLMAGICNDRFPSIQLDDIETITVSFKLRSGPTRTINVPREADAMFFTPSAFDKFVFPYYARVYGVATASAMRQDILGQR